MAWLICIGMIGNKCIICGKQALSFKSELDKFDFELSGYCQACQNTFYEDTGDKLIESEEIIDLPDMEYETSRSLAQLPPPEL